MAWQKKSTPIALQTLNEASLANALCRNVFVTIEPENALCVFAARLNTAGTTTSAAATAADASAAVYENFPKV